MRSLKFNLRDLFWLTIVTGLAVGWWCDRQRVNYVNLSGEVVEHSRDLIEISIGSDAGLKPGHSVEIYHGKTFRTRAVVSKFASHDRAVVQCVGSLHVPKIENGDTVIARVKL